MRVNALGPGLPRTQRYKAVVFFLHLVIVAVKKFGWAHPAHHWQRPMRPASNGHSTGNNKDPRWDEYNISKFCKAELINDERIREPKAKVFVPLLLWFAVPQTEPARAKSQDHPLPFAAFQREK